MVNLQKVRLAEKLDQIPDYWNPRIIGALNGQHVRLAKLRGTFDWHAHANEDELFLVLKGQLVIRFRDGDVTLREGELLIIPRGTEHLPVADEEAHVLLFEPASTVNTGDVQSERTRAELEWI